MRFPQITIVFFLVGLTAFPLLAQSPNGTINGLVLDSSNQAIAGAGILAINDLTGLKYSSKTNAEGVYVLRDLPPGPYRLQVEKIGFKTLVKPDITLNVQDALSINFTLPVGAAMEVVTVQGGAPLVDTETASVSTVVDRQFAENLPLNGRSFQALIQLTPGVVLTSTSNGLDSGQFSVNGQRASSNYWMVDGVSANVGSSAFFGGNGVGGAAATFSVFGGTNSLVSVDAMQEFRIQTSTFAPEFGRTPGAQISIVTRSGTNRFHGTVFDYLRNDLFDANNWFNGYTNSPPLPKAEERQNDFGGTLGGPILKDRTFFFFSYEGLRLRLPQTTLTGVPDNGARQNATPAMQPFLNAFPLPGGPDNITSGVATLNASYSNPASLDAYSLRLDHHIHDALALFARYDYSPSEITQRGPFGSALSDNSASRITVQTATAGATLAISPNLANDVRVNYSWTNAATRFFIDDFRGASPLNSLPFPTPYNAHNGNLFLVIASMANGELQVGSGARNLQRQLNLVDSVSVQKGTHTLKLGADYRRLTPEYSPYLYSQNAYFLDVPSAENGNLFGSFIQANNGSTLLLQNLGAYAEDTWHVTPRLTVTYGLRWDVDFAPSSSSGPRIPAATGFNLADLSQLNLAPSGTPAFATKYGNVAPRVGGTFRIFEHQDWGTVLKAGAGTFYDLATAEVGNFILEAGYPFYAASNFQLGGTFPLSDNGAAPPPIEPPNASNQGILTAFNPDLNLPYALEWNLAIEQGLGKEQTISASYVGSAGRRLIQSAVISSPNPNLGQAVLITNAGTSSYNALQLQFQRRLLSGLQALASYTWSHSIDEASASSFGSGANALTPVNPSVNRGPSDFDVRHSFSVGSTFDVPAVRGIAIGSHILEGWSVENILQGRTALPVNVYDTLYGLALNNSKTVIRPDLVPGIPIYLYGNEYPAGKALNPSAFTAPPTDPSTGAVLRQGDLGRNALRGFGAFQWDFAIHRDFPIHESIKLQFRAEMFNVLNHPNFGQPDGNLSDSTFGLSTQILAQYLSGGQLGGGGFSALYQLGGPRSIQFALKLSF